MKKNTTYKLKKRDHKAKLTVYNLDKFKEKDLRNLVEWLSDIADQLYSEGIIYKDLDKYSSPMNFKLMK
jgi:hypothetical protein